MFVCISSLLLLFLFGVIPSSSSSFLSLSSTRISVLPKPFRFFSTFKQTFSLYNSFSEAFSADDSLFIPSLLLSSCIFVMHPSHLFYYVLHMIVEKFVIMPIMGIMMKNLGCYLNINETLFETF